MSKKEVYALATDTNPIIVDNGNRFEFANGETYVIDPFSKVYYKAKVYNL